MQIERKLYNSVHLTYCILKVHNTESILNNDVNNLKFIKKFPLYLNGFHS